MKKVLSLIIAMVMVLSCMTVFSTAAATYNVDLTMTATVGGKNYGSGETIGVSAGDTVQVVLNLKTNYYTGPFCAHIFYTNSLFTGIADSAFNTSGRFYKVCGSSFSTMVDWSKMAPGAKTQGWPNYTDSKKLEEFKNTHVFARMTMTPNPTITSTTVKDVDENLITLTFKVASNVKNGTTGEIVIPIETARTKSNPSGMLFCGIYDTADIARSQPEPYSDKQSINCSKAVLKFKVGGSSSNLGDVNEDKQVNSTDALWVLQSSVGSRTLTSSQKTNADVNFDTKVNSSDALLILQHIVGSIKSF